MRKWNLGEGRNLSKVTASTRELGVKPKSELRAYVPPFPPEYPPIFLMTVSSSFQLKCHPPPPKEAFPCTPTSVSASVHFFTAHLTIGNYYMTLSDVSVSLTSP